MNSVLSINTKRHGWLSAIAVLVISLQAPIAKAQDAEGVKYRVPKIEQVQTRVLKGEKRAKANQDAYMLGPGDSIEIELLNLPDLSGIFSIGPDGTLYLPRLRSLFVEGMTLEELRVFLTKQFQTYVRDPQIYLRIVVYRPVRIYVGGEVKRPGYYTFTGQQVVASKTLEEEERFNNSIVTADSKQVPSFPTVFDAIQQAEGITPFSDLSEVQVTRNRADSLGGGRLQTNLNFLSLITDGDESQNIRLFSGDVLKVRKSPVALREQLLKAGQSNLSPKFMNVFVSGRVNTPGSVTLPQGSSLNQAISLAGGPKLIKGRVEFIRFSSQGTIDRKIFSYKPGAASNTPNNPILAAGDLIRIQNSLLSGGISVLEEVTRPFVGLYTVYSIFSQ